MAGSGTAHLREPDEVVLSVRDLVVEFPVDRHHVVHAVSGVSFDLAPHETLGIVGESGCGKSTVARAIMQLQAPTSGSVRLEGRELTELRSAELRRVRRTMQMIFQDPVASLNPLRRVGDLVAQGRTTWGEDTDREERARMLSAVGLEPDAVYDRRPNQLSGGQCQRVNIARALMMDPTVLVCDEVVSALDVSIQAQILNLLAETRERLGVGMVFIAHDLGVVKNVSDVVLVMYLGKVCEVVPARELPTGGLHPYTRLLLDSVPGVEEHQERPRWGATSDELPSPMAPPSGCRYRTRCPLATRRCADEEPELRRVGDGHWMACHNVDASGTPTVAPHD